MEYGWMDSWTHLTTAEGKLRHVDLQSVITTWLAT